MSKIQFIVVGWHYNQLELNEGLKELNANNKDINVFWSCHKEPTDYIKNNFDYKLFPNLGEEFIAFQQAIEYLNIDDDTTCFFIHDDIIIKDWGFIEICLNKLQQGYKFLGNCTNYPLPSFDPTKIHHDGIGITKDFDGKTIADYALDETKHWFDGIIGEDMINTNNGQKLKVLPIIRGSFICCKYADLKHIHGFEPRKEAWIPLTWDEEQQTHSYRGGVGQSRFGNLFMFMFSYKINRVFGLKSISYLSDRYLDSDYIYEMARAKIDVNNPMS